VGDLDEGAAFSGEGALVRNQVFQRPQHQGEGSTEFVRDVGEERRLLAVDFFQRQRSSPFFFISLRVGDRRRDLARGEFEKAPVALVEQPERIEPHDQDCSPAGFAVRQDRQQHGLVGGLAPGACRQTVGKRGGKVVDENGLLRPKCLTKRPVHARGIQYLGSVGTRAVDAAGACENEAVTVRIDFVEHGEGNVVPVGGNRPQDAVAGILPGARLGRIRRKLPRQRRSPITR
jgi:hypothetical protein